jgi:hypothetical protein
MYNKPSQSLRREVSPVTGAAAASLLAENDVGTIFVGKIATIRL